MNPEEIIQFCQVHSDIKVCLDTSHTMMASNYYGRDFYNGVRMLMPYVEHMHIVDALGVDGGGANGEMSTLRLSQVLSEIASAPQFIPEIWQGHKNDGEGFWQALNYLDEIGFAQWAVDNCVKKFNAGTL